MTKKYWLNYESQPLAEVDIDDSPEATAAIKDMVKFWMGAEEALERNGGDYTTTFLKSLAMFMLNNHRIPNNDEGWVPFDGSYGIKVSNFYRYDFDEDQIEIS